MFLLVIFKEDLESEISDNKFQVQLNRLLFRSILSTLITQDSEAKKVGFPKGKETHRLYMTLWLKVG